MNSLNNEIKMNKSKTRWTFIGLILLCFTLIVGFYIHAILQPFSKVQISEVSNNWLYYTKDEPDNQFKSQHVKRLPNVAKDETMVMERRMQKKIADPVLLLQAHQQWASVTLDDQLLYQNSPINDEKPGTMLTEIRLPNDYVGKTLRIELSSPYQSYAGLPAKVFIGNANSLLAYVISVSFPQLMMFLLGIITSLVSLVIALRMLVKEKKVPVTYILFALYALTVGLQAINVELLNGLLFSPTFNSSLGNLLICLTPLLLVGFYYSQMDQIKRYYRYWVIPYLGLSCIILLYAAFTKTDLAEVKVYLDAFSVFGTLATCSACIAESHRKNRFFVVCTPWIVLVALAHCFLYIMQVVDAEPNLINWSGFFFAMIMVIIGIYLVIELVIHSEKNKRKVNFLEIKTQLLEENRQSLVSHLTEIDQLKDDFYQKLTLIKMMAEDQNLTGVREYLEQLLDTPANIELPEVFCEHELVNLILTRYQKIARQKSIALEFQIQLSKELTISDDDLTQLFAHLMEHACRQTYAVNDPSQRKICLRIEQTSDRLLITCKHTKPDPQNLFEQGIIPENVEEDQINLWMLEHISKKYAGKLQHDRANGKDAFLIALRLEA